MHHRDQQTHAVYSQHLATQHSTSARSHDFPAHTCACFSLIVDTQQVTRSASCLGPHPHRVLTYTSAKGTTDHYMPLCLLELISQMA